MLKNISFIKNSSYLEPEEKKKIDKLSKPKKVIKSNHRYPGNGKENIKKIYSYII